MTDREKVIKELRLIYGWFKNMKLCHPEKAEMYDNAKNTIADALSLLKEQETVKTINMENDIVYGLSEISLYLSNIGKDDFAQTIEDACKKFELLKEHEARVMALDELTEIYVEFKGDNCPIRLINFDLQKIVKYAVNGDCRLWAGKPTDEQRQAVKWE